MVNLGSSIYHAQDIIKQYKRNNKKFYFWFEDKDYRILPVMITSVDAIGDAYTVIATVSYSADVTIPAIGVYAGLLFNSKKQLIEALIDRYTAEWEYGKATINEFKKCDTSYNFDMAELECELIKIEKRLNYLHSYDNK